MPETTLIPEGYRVLTLEEIRKQAEAMEHLEDWRILHSLVLRYYGEQAALVEIETEAEYNDEGGMDERIYGFTVMTAEKQQCKPDPALSWFQEELQRKPEKWEGEWKDLRARALACQEANEPLDEELIEEIQGWVTTEHIREVIRDSITAEAHTYNLRKEPALPYAVVLAPITIKETTHA